jgi:hypothetical protein
MVQPSKAAGGRATKILVQYRVKRGMVYEIKSAEDVLVVEIASAVDESSGRWRVQARGDATSESPPIDGWGSTRAEALSDAARAWSAHASGLAPLDWEAVARELREVRAL